jgi:iron complex transport system ATP-binding protein
VELVRIIRKLATERGVGVLMASHDLNLAASFADRMIVLGEGRIVKEGRPAEVMDAKVLGDVYGIEMERVESAGGTIGVWPVVK